MASPFDAEFPLASTPVIMVSPPDTQDGPQDVFHTPPEESSLPSSDDQRRTPAVDVDVDQCVVNQAVDVNAGTQGFVDLGKDSELGFSEAHLSQEIDAEVVPDCSRGSEGDALGKIPKSHFDEFGVLEREFSDMGELPFKKQKHSEHNLGFDSSGDFSRVQMQKVEEAMGKCDQGKPVSDAGDLQPQENIETCVVEGAEDFNLIERNKSSDEVVEGSGIQDPGLRVLPISMCGENVAKELQSKEGRKKNKYFVFDVLKALAAENTSEDDDDDVGSVSLLEAAKQSGITFPRPRWWPDHFDFNNQSKD